MVPKGFNYIKGKVYIIKVEITSNYSQVTFLFSKLIITAIKQS